MPDRRPAAPAALVETVNVREAHDLATRGDALIVDVREPDEWAEARIPGAVHIPLGEIAERSGELPKDRLLVLQCRSGRRSHAAAEALLAQGFGRVRNLTGGILAWSEASLPLER